MYPDNKANERCGGTAMRWKDTDNDNGEATEKSDPYYEDDGYATFKEKGLKKPAILSGNPVKYLYWGLGIAVVAGVVLLVMLLFSNLNESADLARINDLEEKIVQLEQRLDKYDGMDEKVTRIWEQAKAFEKFKTRFDRSEASMSLRMDHLAMSLDALQKKTDSTMKKVAQLEKPPVAAKPSPVEKKPATTVKTHTVAAGDTLFNISRRYNLSVAQLKAINKLPKGAVIHVGQKLKVSASSD
jgi:LysM repeat protein